MEKVQNVNPTLEEIMYKARRLFFLAPILLGLMGGARPPSLIRSPFVHEAYDILCFLIVLAGISVRLVASGTSIRFFRCRASERIVRKGAIPLSGIFSLWRHPHFIGDLVIVSGLVLLSQNLKIASASLLIFLLCYFPLLIQKEKWMKEKLGTAYALYKKNTHLFLPSFKSWKKSNLRFHMTAALYKEGGMCLYVVFLFVFLEGLSDSLPARHLLLSHHWLALAFTALMVWTLHHWRVLTSEEIDSQEWPE